MKIIFINDVAKRELANKVCFSNPLITVHLKFCYTLINLVKMRTTVTKGQQQKAISSTHVDILSNNQAQQILYCAYA